MPVGIKDLVAVAGMPMPGGSPAYRDFVPDEDDVVVERLRGAGAIVLGKTEVTEFGYSGAGHTPLAETDAQPVEPRAHLGRLERRLRRRGRRRHGAGRDRQRRRRLDPHPGAFCGLYGIKASMGRVPLYPGCRDERYPGISSWESLEHIGPMSRTVADAALVLSVIAGPDTARPPLASRRTTSTGAPPAAGDLRGLRVAYSADLGHAAVDPEVARASSTEAAGVFERDLGCEVERADPGLDDPTTRSRP